MIFDNSIAIQEFIFKYSGNWKENLIIHTIYMYTKSSLSINQLIFLINKIVYN